MKQNATSTRSLCRRVLGRVAPAWPLDGAVAVNPYWGFAEQDLPSVAAQLQTINGERLFMSRRWYAERLARGELSEDDIARAAKDLGLDDDLGAWRRWLAAEDTAPPALVTLPELFDRPGRPPVSDFVIEQISRFLAAWYDRGQAQWKLPGARDEALFAAWRQYTLHDRSLAAMGLGKVRRQLLGLEQGAEAAADWARAALDLPEAVEEAYFLALLKSIGGWAAWCRHLAWKAELAGDENHDLAELFAIRLVWEATLRRIAPADVAARWREALQAWSDQDFEAVRDGARRHEVLLRASETAYRRRLASAFARAAASVSAAQTARPRVQAAFCIDVRSEVYRRHLEACMPGLETLGYAGFFGIPLAFRRNGDAQPRAQAPVLLNPTLQACEQLPPAVNRRRLGRLRRSAMWKQFKLSAASCFSFVETAGLSYAARLLADSLGWHQPSRHPDEAGLAQDERAKWQVALSDTLDLESRVQLAASILAGLGLKDRIAPLVLLVGHGSSTTNNPHRAGLDCGACAGQTGEVNARAAAALLNDPEVRAALATRGRALPADCRFVPALHDTTCDQLRLLETLPAPVASSGLEEALRAALERAGELVRLERAVRLEPEAGAVAAPHLPGRGRDWSQVRPEWALAGNAAFIAAPRRLSRGLDLAGRAFLHEYEAAEDPGFAVLTTLMTAPLIVANWINMQYYASTVDNQRQGCGNKALHNVVGGTLGVLEGNGGDLRIGLSEQSLRDVEGRLQHEPLRLCAIIAAPREAMDAIIAAHAPLRRLIDGRWLSLCQLCDDGALYERFAAGDWRPMA